MAEVSLFRAAAAHLAGRCAGGDVVDAYIANLIDRSKTKGQLEYNPGASEDAAFTFAQSPLSITELCVRHQYCEHVRGKEKRLGDDPFSLKLRRGDSAGVEALAQLFIAAP